MVRACEGPAARRLILVALLSALSATLTLPAAAMPPAAPARLVGTIVLQNGSDGYGGCLDTMINRWQPFDNYENTNLSVEFSSSGDIRSSLIQFDLTPVPAGATIISAVLGLNATSSSFDTNLTINAYPLLRPWLPDQATWAQAAVSDPWGAAGANNTTTDREAVPAVSLVTAGAGRWYDFDVTGVVRRWYGGEQLNFGLVLRAEGTSGPAGKSLYSFVDSSSGATLFRPKLTVTYEFGATNTPTRTRTPTPSQTPEGPTHTPTHTRTPTRTATPTQPSPIATLELQNGLNGYTGCDDTHISTFAKNSNFGGNGILNLRAKHEENLLIRFDLSALSAVPAGATIDAAVLSLWCTNQSNTSPIEVNSYRLLRPWNEMQATWNQARTGDLWGQPGAFQMGVDRAPETASLAVLDSKDMWMHLDWTFLMSHWRGNPSINYGAVISGTGWAHVTYWFASSENAAPEIRPRLIITYTNPTWTPTATSPATNTPTRTRTPTQTRTPTATATSTSTATRTHTATATQTGTRTPTATVTRTVTPTATPTRTVTGTQPPTATPTLTPSPTATVGAGPDAYEPDNTCAQARLFTVNGTPQQHNFHQSTDEDWVGFMAIAGRHYVVETFYLGPIADTYMYLYRTNCTTVVTENDDGGPGFGSRIEWTADATDMFFVRVRPYSAAKTGEGSDYRLRIERISLAEPAIWLPLVRKQ